MLQKIINPNLDTTEQMQAKHLLPNTNTWQMVQVSTNCPVHGLVVREVVSIIAETARHTCPKCLADEQAYQEQIHINKERERLAYKSGISHYKDFSVWQPFGEQAQRMQGVVGFAKEYFHTHNGKNIIMTGETGTGKTLLANLIATDFIKHGKRVEVIRSSDINNQVRASWSKYSDTTEHELMKYWINQDLLVIDELGEADLSYNAEMQQTDRERLSRIIDGRYSRNLPTIITTNLTKEVMIERLGDRAWDRLSQKAVMIACNWGSFRKANQNFVEI